MTADECKEKRHRRKATEISTATSGGHSVQRRFHTLNGVTVLEGYS